MAKHKTRSIRGSAILVTALAACAALLFTVFGSGSAGADPVVAPGKKASVKNANVTGICNFTAQGINASTGQVSIRLAAQAQPTTLLGYAKNVYTQMFCSVKDAVGNVVATFNPYVDGPYLANITATQNAVPYSSKYFVCATGFVKLSNGSQSTTNTVCV
jgi:hypothetical protein